MFNYRLEFRKLNLKVLPPQMDLKLTHMNEVSFQLFLFRVDKELMGIDFKIFKDNTIEHLLEYASSN